MTTRCRRRASIAWFAVPAVALMVLPLLARRRFPFAAPASVWMLAAALSFVDGRLIPFTAARRGRRDRRGVSARQPARPARRHGTGWRSCSAARRSSSTTTRTTAGGASVFTPLLFAIGWLAGFAMRERVVASRGGRAARGPRRARARGGRPHRGRRGARADRARAARHRRARRQRDGAPGRRGPAQPPGRAQRRPEALARRRAHRPHARSPRCGACSARCAARATTPTLAPQPGLDGLDVLVGAVRPRRAPGPRSASTASRVPLPDALDLSAYRDRPGGAHQRAEARAREPGRRDRALRPGRARDRGLATTATASRCQRGTATDTGSSACASACKIYGGEMTAGTGERRRLRPPHAPPAPRPGP